jgi:cytosine/adenosine deaminase-related metal-dependent hydrolase
MASILIQNAEAIVTVDGGDRVLKNANLYAEDGIIRSVGAEAPRADETVDARGCFVYPGLVNTHHHLYQTFTRNLPGVQKLELFDWLRALYEIWRHMDEEWVYYGAMTGIGELVKYGCTTVMDHHYVFPGSAPGFLDREFDAANALGARLTAARGSMSRGRSGGGLPPDDLVEKVDGILAESGRLVEKHHDPSAFSMKQVVLAPCSPFSVTTDLLKETAVLARDLGVRLHTHLCETVDEQNYCLEAVGMRPLDYMESVGWVGSDVWYAHGIHFDDRELDLLAQTQTGVAHCPVSNMKLASGVCRIPDLLEKAVPVGLAVDGSASNDCSNLMAEIRAAYLMHRLAWSGRAPGGYDLLKLATKGSARVLGRGDIGSLEAGKAADFFLIDVDRLECAGARQDPAAFLGTVGYGAPAKLVAVGGRVVARDGRLEGVDEPELTRKANAAAAKVLQKAGLA